MVLWCVFVLVGSFVRLFLFFKQKTAYEMRISDWSSDVCSSDLRSARRNRHPARRAAPPPRRFPPAPRHGRRRRRPSTPPSPGGGARETRRARRGRCPKASQNPAAARSEEHTSELQSLMRISYAVFCLTKKNTPPNSNNMIQTNIKP